MDGYSPLTHIIVTGAQEHNLKNITVAIPRNRLVVITGPSGSGKSSLAFDTLFAEGQRRYIESLSSYARQFLDQLQKPKVERIEGLAPAIAIEQRSASVNPRSIVATTTEIYDYLRLLFAHVGIPHCPRCHGRLESQTVQQICNRIMGMPPGRKLMILSPYVRGRKGEHQEILKQIQKDGFVRVRIDGVVYAIEDEIQLEKNVKHHIEAVVDRLYTGFQDRVRLADSIERAWRTGNGLLILLIEDELGSWSEVPVSEKATCHSCGVSLGEILPRNFSFNSPYGACPACHGLGVLEIPDLEQVIRGSLPAHRACTLLNYFPPHIRRYYRKLILSVVQHAGFSPETPFARLSPELREIIRYGSGNDPIPMQIKWGHRTITKEEPFEGLVSIIMKRYRELQTGRFHDAVQAILQQTVCPHCKGSRLRPESLAVTVGGINIHQFIQHSVEKAIIFLDTLKLQGEAVKIASELIREIRNRLLFLADLGLEYLTLDRMTGTLSGGEFQRIRLATQLGSGLTGVMYVLDEPTIGLHPRDNYRLIATLKRLVQQQNSVIVVEHDLDTIRSADYVLDLGPGAGVHGGRIVAQGSPEEIASHPSSLTGQYLSGRKSIPLPRYRRSDSPWRFVVIDANYNNLKNLTVEIPGNTITCITGVSGSGKSSLLDFIASHPPIIAPSKEKEGFQIVWVDQTPIGRTPRSNPVTYTGAFDYIRNLFAQVPEAKARGYKASRFSFNLKGGRCEACEGAGIRKIEMHFLPDVFIPCEHCQGSRYNRETLDILYNGKTIYDVLQMTVDEAVAFFQSIPSLVRILQTLQSVGLGYIQLGQPATTLSGGEAQRIKLAAELIPSGRPRQQKLYILDEPTTGLHIDDVAKLISVLFQLRDRGHTILVVEHNLEVVKVADWVIDLGPEGGEKGGMIVCQGPPETIAKCPQSYTGRYLYPLLFPQQESIE